MTKLEALKKLAARVEAGEWPGGIDGAAHRVFPYNGLIAAEAFDGSLDAARALHEAFLPEWWLSALCQTVTPIEGARLEWRARLTNSDYDAYAEADDPARAWLIAILRALIAKETDQ